MTLYQCRHCTAVFTNPSGSSCPACGHTGPTVYDVSGDDSYDNNWYEPLRGEVAK